MNCRTNDTLSHQTVFIWFAGPAGCSGDRILPFSGFWRSFEAGDRSAGGCCYPGEYPERDVSGSAQVETICVILKRYLACWYSYPRGDPTKRITGSFCGWQYKAGIEMAVSKTFVPEQAGGMGYPDGGIAGHTGAGDGGDVAGYDTRDRAGRAGGGEKGHLDGYLR